MSLLQVGGRTSAPPPESIFTYFPPVLVWRLPETAGTPGNAERGGPPLAFRTNIGEKMTWESRIASVFRLDEAGWARHANPWSGWTRFVTLPLLVAAIWSRTWLGYWSLIPVALALWWTWFNPRAFAPAEDDHAWMTKCVLGERFWSNRADIGVPERHRTIPNLLNVASMTGLPFLVWGLITSQLWPTVLGMVLIAGAKLWYVDRMAILYDDMVSAHPQLRYRRPDSNEG